MDGKTPQLDKERNWITHMGEVEGRRPEESKQITHMDGKTPQSAKESN